MLLRLLKNSNFGWEERSRRYDALRCDAQQSFSEYALYSQPPKDEGWGFDSHDDQTRRFRRV